MAKAVLAWRFLLPGACLLAFTAVAGAPGQERVLGLQGAPNFRDIGGYPTNDGRHVRWGVVYRSNTLSALTPADETKVSTLHIVSEVDLRTVQERADAPDRWLQPPGDIYQSPKPSLQPLIAALVANVHDVESARQNMEHFYARMPDEYRPEYAALFHRLAAGDAPILVHCTAGKDRTGVAAAILLRALGVPRAKVVSDYSMSEALLPRPTAAVKAGAVPAHIAAAVQHIPPAARIEMTRSDPAFIDAALDSIDHEYGSVDAYLKAGLGLNDAQIEAMRSHLTQE
jgi:protein-tyrosine phosphatase